LAPFVVNKGILISEIYKTFYVNKEENPIVVLSVQQLKFPMWDKIFAFGLPPNLSIAKDIFTLDCSAGRGV